MLFIFICGPESFIRGSYNPTDILETFKNERPNTLIQDQIGTFQIQLKAVCLACLFVFQHTGSELVYVNTLQSVPSFSVVKKKTIPLPTSGVPHPWSPGQGTITQAQHSHREGGLWSCGL